MVRSDVTKSRHRDGLIGSRANEETAMSALNVVHAQFAY
jgi:hypothetical protein